MYLLYIYIYITLDISSDIKYWKIILNKYRSILNYLSTPKIPPITTLTPPNIRIHFTSKNFPRSIRRRPLNCLFTRASPPPLPQYRKYNYYFSRISEVNRLVSRRTQEKLAENWVFPRRRAEENEVPSSIGDASWRD